MDSLSVCCGIATTGGLREVQIVRFRQNHRRFYTGKQQHLVRIGYGYGPGRRGMVMVAASSKSAEAEGVSLRRAVKEELVDGESQQQKAQGRGLVHAVHESARVFLAGLREQKTLASRPWFPLQWPTADKNAWMQALAYQAAVHSLIQAVIDIAARGEGRNRNVRVFVQRRLMDLASPLEDSIRHELSSRDPAADDWLWLQQHPLAVAKFVKLLEGDNRFINITSTDGAVNLAGSDVELLKMALSSTASLVMLGAAPVSNPIFSSKLVQAIYYLMDKMSECIPMNQVHRFCTDVGLKREFLGKFGSRAADDKKWRDSAEGEFWVYLVHQLLRGALVREGVRLRLKSRDTVEVLEKDLAVFGFFAVLGRSTRTYLASKGVSDSEESLASLLRYLEGGSVLFYPQLATIPIYQLFIEVVCEEMEWLPYYPVSTTAVVSHDSHGDNGQVKSGVGKVEKLLAIAVAVQVCSLWVKSFVEHNVWIRQPEGIRAATFLSKSQQRLEECNEVYELVKRNGKDDSFWRGASEGEYMDRLIYQDLQERCAEEASTSGVDRSGSDMEPLGTNEQLVKERRKLQEVEQLLKSVDKELQSVDIALAKLELLVKESEDAGLAGSERLRADLDKIRSLKQDVEVLKASLKSKASAREVRILELQADPQSINVQDRNLGATADDWNFQFQRRRRSDLSDSADEKTSEASKSVKTFEQLMVELSELESRIQQSADQSASVRSLSQEEWERASVYEVATTTALARIDENLDLTVVNRNFLTKSIEQLKEASVDIWRGSCLLGTDVGASLVLLRRKVLGQKLTSREKKILKRTATDIASVVPIGILMLLPVTAVGHAAILAAIQKYVPALIPSAYGPQRLDVLRRLEQLREMEPETPEAAALPPSSRDIDGSMQKETV